jgi:V8-like Glu-specific endopeptidase
MVSKRKQVMNMNVHPYNAIGRLEMKFIIKG